MEQAVQETGKTHSVMVTEALKAEEERSRQAIETALDEERQKSTKQVEELKVRLSCVQGDRLCCVM